MATLYVQEQGATVRKRAQQVLITKDDQTLQEVPLTKIEQVVIMGRGVQISTALLVDLLGRGIPVTLTNSVGSRHYATLTAGPSRFGALRVQQLQRVNEPIWTLELARAIIRAKLANQRALLAGTGWPAAPTAMSQIAAAATALEGAASLDAVRGYEGSCAAAYFGAWRVTLQRDWGFEGRAFHPPPDPVNTMLSFGYTLLLHDVLTAVHLAGLDPYLGTFHVIEAGRPSLALDVMEEFRPLVVDQIVCELLQDGQLRPEQFEHTPNHPGAVQLDSSGRALLIARYEAAMQTPTRLSTGERTPLRRALLLQAQMVARVVRGDQRAYSGHTP